MIQFKGLRNGTPVFVRDWKDISSVEGLHNEKGELIGSQIVVGGIGHQVTAVPADIADETGDIPAEKKKKPA